MISLFASMLDLQDSEVPSQTTLQAGLRIRYLIGRLEIDPSMTWYYTEWASTDTSDLRFEIRATRLLF
jgi:hypothetical protein